jgi:hypothetical protein
MLVEPLVRDAAQLGTRKDGQNLPAEIEGFLQRSVFIRLLINKSGFQLVAEFQVELVVGGKLVLADARGEAAGG